MIFLRDATGLYVNLFVPAEVEWEHAGHTIRLRQETDYPEAETSRVRLDMAKPTTFALRFRVPGWSKGTSFAVNGEPVATSKVPASWAAIEREWQPGDTVSISIPMELRAVPVDRQHPDRAAIMYGPVVLAQDEACCRRPFAIAPAMELTTRLVKDGPGLRFRILNTIPERHTRYLQPLYSVRGFWTNWVYFDLTAPPLY